MYVTKENTAVNQIIWKKVIKRLSSEIIRLQLAGFLSCVAYVTFRHALVSAA